MATATTNTILTQIALKRLSGKALTSGKQSLPQEPFGSTVQSSATTIFGEVVPNTADNTVSDLFYIQSASVNDPGTIQLVDFDLIPLANGKYQNIVDADNDTEESGYNQDTGVTTVDTFHAYMLRLTGSYEQDVNAIGATYFADNASTDKVLGTSPEFSDNFIASASVQFQVVPEYLSTEVGSSNPYIPVVIASDGSSTIPFTDSSRNMYFDAFSGILFVQDPVDYGTTTDGVAGFDLKDSAATIPAKLRAFLYVGKFQSEVVSGDTVDLHISASGGTGFSISNASTASFSSGSAGISVTAGGATNTITIGASTDNVTFNNITALGDIIAQNYIVSSSVTYMTQSFSSGSTIFGDTVGGANADTHQFTGSIFVTGSTFTWNGLGSSDIITPLVIDSNGNITTGSAYATSASLALLSSSFEEVEASASAGIHFSSSVGSFSVPLTNTASFSASGAGLTVNLTSGDVEYVVDPNTLIEAVDTATEINITASYASTASGIIVTDDEETVANYPVVFHDGNNLKSDDSYFTYNPGLAQIRLGNDTDKSLLIASYSIDILPGGDTFSLLTSGPDIINFGTAVTTINYGAGASTLHKMQGGVIFDGVSNPSPLTLRTVEFTSSIDIDLIHPDTGSFHIRNISSSAERTPLVISDDGRVQKADADFAVDIVSSGSQILTVTSSNDFFGVVFTKRVTSELTDHGQLQEHVPQGTTGFTFIPSRTQLKLQNQINETVGNSDLLTLEPGSILTSGSNTFSLLTDVGSTIGPETINVGTSDGTVFFQGSASIAGDLIVQGEVTSIQTTNLNIEDQFILLSSGSNSPQDSGIIVAYGAQSGPALYYDSDGDRWAVNGKNSAVSWDATAATPDQWIVTVSASNATPTGDPSDFGDPDSATYALGMMYIDTGDNDNDGNNIWIYA